METARVTLRDIAKKLGVSHVTVSLALRNHPRISEPVRLKVHEEAKAMGYRPDPMLVALSHYRLTKREASVQAAIAWINSWTKPSQLRHHKEFDAYWAGASACAEKYGYHLEEFALSTSLSSKRLQTILTTRNIAGILLPPAQSGFQQALSDFDWNHFSIVRLGRSWNFPASHVVTSDQFQNSTCAYEKAIEYGYKRIGFIGQLSKIRQFVAGFLFSQAQDEGNAKLPPLLITADAKDGPDQIIKWIKTNRPDAIITEDARLPEILKKNGYKVPDDIALAGLSLLDGGIDAGIDQHSSEVGRIAVSSVVSLINEHNMGAPAIPSQTLVPGSWVDGPMMPKKKTK